ncbi:unnamed protein product [Allacma fusca]|uniref:Uncharacterized protein n=1 Tax=Allacma fusca TaxID=39272 RepID=A0A8J2NFW2_9HEXA|nr:unnamed protein product [Allacma fusca]
MGSNCSKTSKVIEDGKEVTRQVNEEEPKDRNTVPSSTVPSIGMIMNESMHGQAIGPILFSVSLRSHDSAGIEMESRGLGVGLPEAKDGIWGKLDQHPGPPEVEGSEEKNGEREGMFLETDRGKAEKCPVKGSVCAITGNLINYFVDFLSEAFVTIILFWCEYFCN